LVIACDRLWTPSLPVIRWTCVSIVFGAKGSPLLPDGC
jgi:hypothetical protein